MPTTELVVARIEDAPAVSDAVSLDQWTRLDISLLGDVAFHELIAHLTDRDAIQVINAMENLTPPPQDAEDWDDSAWVTPVFLLQSNDLGAIRGISTQNLPDVAQWLYSIDTLRFHREHAADFSPSLVTEILSSVQSFVATAGDRAVLMRCGM